MDPAVHRQMLRLGLPRLVPRDPEARRLIRNAKRRLRYAIRRKLNRIIAHPSRGVGPIHGSGGAPE